MKICRHCGGSKVTQDFYTERGKKDCLTSYCKECDRLRNRGWKTRNYEAYREGERIRRIKSLERNLARVSRWKKSHPEAVRASNINRRAKKGGIGGGEIRKLLETQHQKCTVCGVSLIKGFHVDHILPLKLGGSNDITNIQLLCPPCNLSKGARHPEAFAKRLFLRNIT